MGAGIKKCTGGFSKRKIQLLKVSAKSMRSTKYKTIIWSIIIAAFSISCAKSQSADKSLAISKAGVPPKTWKEHWFEHNQLLSRVYYDDNVAVYYDAGMNTSVTWPYKAISDVWAYVKKTYGNFGDSTRLYAVFHQGTYGGGHPSPYFDESHDYRNTIDCGLGDWTKPEGEQIGMPVHEIGHIVSGASHGAKGSPSDALWGDSKFMEIFNYDVLMNVGRVDEAEKVYRQMQTQHDNFPRADTQWFKNWFYPIYSQYGKAALLDKYFALLAGNFPKDKDSRFTRDLNWGEFVHFWSGAAGINLKEQATLAFGWTAEWEAQFEQAQKEFPNVKYKSTIYKS
jgi:hypothetical protein